MTEHATALTFDGEVTIERDIPLGRLQVGDTVLGRQDLEDSAAPRTTHVVTAELGGHYVPCEEPGRLERFLVNIGLEAVIAGGRIEGILVDGTYGPGLFALEDGPTLDRVRL